MTDIITLFLLNYIPYAIYVYYFVWKPMKEQELWENLDPKLREAFLSDDW